MHRFSRIERFLGSERHGHLRRAHVAVIGLGAVGSYATEALARSGVGRLTLVDFDLVQESNLNRQLLALGSTVGRPKIEIAAERVADINPDCVVDARRVFVDHVTVASLFEPRPDAVIDAIDSMAPKVTLLAHCWAQGLPTWSSMGAALRSDPTRVRMADVHDTHHCPLAAHVRYYLRKRAVGRGLRCVYSTEAVNFKYTPVSEETEPWVGGRGRRRHVLGSLPTLTGIFGLMLANEVILKLAGRGDGTDGDPDPRPG